MEGRIRKKQYIKNASYKYFIYVIGIIALLQLLTLKACYKEKIFKLPEKLFSSRIDFPISELTLDMTYSKPETESEPAEGSDTSTSTTTKEASETEAEESQSNKTGNQNLTDIQKNIALKAMELLDKDIEYGYQLFPDTGYPTGNVWISTDVISITLRDCGYNLMELMYKDMNEHKEDYPMDKTGRKTPIKYIDFRDVIFQEQFFNRNALTLPAEYIVDDESNNLIWQAGDIVYFRFDENNLDKDRGGFISSHTNPDGVPMVIMICPETNKLEEVDILLEYEIVGHHRYPQPEVN